MAESGPDLEQGGINRQTGQTVKLVGDDIEVRSIAHQSGSAGEPARADQF